MIELLITLAIGVFIGYQVGIAVIAWRLRDVIYKEAKAKGMITEKDRELFEGKQQPTVAKLWIEKSHDILYMYHYDKETFVCQGSTVEELAKLAFERNNIKYAAVVSADGESFAFVDGAVKTQV